MKGRMVADKSFLAWLASEPGKAALAGAADTHPTDGHTDR